MKTNSTKSIFVPVVAPVDAHRTVVELIKAYVEDMKQKSPKTKKGWGKTTVRDRMSDLRNLSKAAGGATCADLDLEIFDRAINFPGSRAKSDFVRRQIDACLRWGIDHGWTVEEQRRLLRMATYKAPEGYVDAPSRRKRAKLAGVDKDLYQGGDVPSHRQVTEWGGAAGAVYAQGEGLAHTAANTGLRIDELLACTADPEIARLGLGNLVHVERTRNGIKMTVQVVRPRRELTRRFDLGE